ncbi:hypothetical protein T265_06257 [Opisthorchis viverrini]|uniref:Uncharacterized protein n=1 Tax=Opisthorchis viverrini TaxID=6198 RepID=A0A075AE74_OPIVI|nr:hypothetical protein T265_06257 [Opisthorchis viverrini]KER26539.1 hypothetical protein T265_06257 [Opisthorchis viverrini]
MRCAPRGLRDSEGGTENNTRLGRRMNDSESPVATMCNTTVNAPVQTLKSKRPEERVTWSTLRGDFAITQLEPVPQEASTSKNSGILPDRESDKSVHHAFLISPHIKQTILGEDFLMGTDSVVDLKQGKLVTGYCAIELEGYPSTVLSELHVRKLPSFNVPSVQSVVKEYSELFTGD